MKIDLYGKRMEQGVEPSRKHWEGVKGLYHTDPDKTLALLLEEMQRVACSGLPPACCAEWVMEFRAHLGLADAPREGEGTYGTG